MRILISFGLVIALFVTLSWSDSLTELFVDKHKMQLQRTTVEKLFELANGLIDQDGDKERMAMLCNVDEGAWCYLLPFAKLAESLGDQALEGSADSKSIGKEMAMRVTNELGVEFIAHSINNSVRVQCLRSMPARHVLSCKINRGKVWEKLAIQ